ncbi:MAG: hypothetical protein JNK49_20155 [Planctomycetes bacterium]|nr:hypothetical protein [Planctomycetota bacterium]
MPECAAQWPTPTAPYYAKAQVRSGAVEFDHLAPGTYFVEASGPDFFVRQPESGQLLASGETVRVEVTLGRLFLAVLKFAPGRPTHVKWDATDPYLSVMAIDPPTRARQAILARWPDCQVLLLGMKDVVDAPSAWFVKATWRQGKAKASDIVELRLPSQVDAAREFVWHSPEVATGTVAVQCTDVAGQPFEDCSLLLLSTKPVRAVRVRPGDVQNLPEGSYRVIGPDLSGLLDGTFSRVVVKAGAAAELQLKLRAPVRAVSLRLRLPGGAVPAAAAVEASCDAVAGQPWRKAWSFVESPRRTLEDLRLLLPVGRVELGVKVTGMADARLVVDIPGPGPALPVEVALVRVSDGK